jgi:hypothetical protein
MGFFSELFSKPDDRYPVLDDAHPASGQLASVEAPFRDLSQRTKDRLEVVPSEAGAYVFVGKPPKQFGLVWFEGGEGRNLKDYVAEKKLDAKKIARLVDCLTEAYQRSSSEPRYRAKLAGRDVVVAPSPQLAKELRGVLESGVNG